MADIFLSYANRDVDRIKSLVEVLEQEGRSVWWDHKIRIGKRFDQVIEEEITKAKCIVVLWSKESVQSDWVKSEADEGRRRQILAPALIENVVIPMEFRRIEAAKLYDWQGDLSHPELKLLLLAIGEIVGQPTQKSNSKELVGQSRRPKVRFHFGKSRIGIAITGVLVAFLTGGILIVRHFFPSATAVLLKVEGDQQMMPAGGWKNFVVKVVDEQGRPVVGAKVAWQTPECGFNVYVGETDNDGLSGATNMCNVLPSGTHTQTATIIERDTPKGFTNVERVSPKGKPVIFRFQQQ